MVSVTKRQLTLSIIFNGTNSFIFLYYLYRLLFNFRTLKYLTMLSYYANSTFLFICLYCDVILYYENPGNVENDYKLIKEPQNNENDSQNLYEKLNDWNRNKFGVICNTFSYYVTISYWLLVSMGKNYIEMDNDLIAFIETLYLHLILTILIIIDIFVSERKKLQFSWDYYWIIAGLFLLYCAFNYIEKYTYDKNTYPFMHNSFMLLILFIGIALILLLLCYLNHIYLLRYK